MKYRSLPAGSSIYLAGPMRGYPRYNFDAFDAALLDLRLDHRDFSVYSGHEYDLNNGFDPDTTSLDDWDLNRSFQWDMQRASECDATVLLPGWEASTGACFESHVAMLFKRKLFEFESGEPIQYRQAAWAISDKMMEKYCEEGVVEESPHSTQAANPRDILLEAHELINGDRNVQYGDPNADFQRTADMWTALFGRPFKKHEVAMAMICMKLSRLSWCPSKKDSWVDMGGYAGCGYDCVSTAIKEASRG